MSHYSFLNLAKKSPGGHRSWQPFWRSVKPKKHCDVIIIGAGGQGLATAYYLQHKYGVKDIAVLEKGWSGGGNTGRNTRVVRSNYFFAESAAFYDHFNINARYSVVGDFIQPRGGIVRHDAVAWGLARGAYRGGVDIIENCLLPGIAVDANHVTGVTTLINPTR